jgi:hypothetical protein
MHGIHDLGGMHGFGAINPEENEPIFHEEWERRAFALFAGTFVFGGYTGPEFRYVVERMEPLRYLKATYYETWLEAFEELLVRHGHITRQELDDRIAELKKESR